MREGIGMERKYALKVSERDGAYLLECEICGSSAPGISDRTVALAVAATHLVDEHYKK